MKWFSVQRVKNVAHVQIRDHIGCFGFGADTFLAAVGDAKEVRLSVNSIGGDAQAATEIHNAIKGRTSVATITGRCGSSAVPIALAAKRVRIDRTGRFLIHAPSQHVLGRACDLRQSAAYLDRLTLQWIDIFSKRADPELVREWLTSDNDVWLPAKAALACGLCDEVYDLPTVDASDELPASVAPVAPVVDDAQERLLLDLLRAVGPITTANKPRLFRELSMWFTTNVHPIS